MANEDQQENKQRPAWTSKALTILRKWVLLPLVGALISVMLIGRVVDWVIGPKAYKVYVVGNFEGADATQNPNPSTADSIWAGISGQGSLSDINGVPIKFEKWDDAGDPVDAQRISADLATRNDSLLVVGHFASTQTKAALPAYLRIATPPIPVILTTETNPALLPPRSRATGYDPLFRLSPTDEGQAVTAATFAIAHGARGFWVVETVSNPVYSQFLTRKFSEQALARSSRVVLWTNNLSVPPVQTIQTLNVDWVFFAGGWQDALILVRQIRAMPGGHNVNVILSDAAVDLRLIQQGSDAVKDVYVTHPMLAETYEGKAGYGMYGYEAFQLTQQLVDKANANFGQIASRTGGFGYWFRRFLGLRRATDARNVMAAVMQDAVLQGIPFRLNGGICRFRPETATCEGASFHVWQVQNGTFKTVQ